MALGGSFADEHRSILDKMSLVASEENTAEDGKAEMVYLRESGDYSSLDVGRRGEHFVDEDGNSDPVEDDDGRIRWTRIWQGGAVALFVLSIVSLAPEVHAMSIASSILKICRAGAVYKSKFNPIWRICILCYYYGGCHGMP